MVNVTLDNYVDLRLKDPKFRQEWGKSEAQYELTKELIKARLEKKLSQIKLAQKSHTTQAVISRIESMSVNPSLGLLEKIARALEKDIDVRLRDR